MRISDWSSDVCSSDLEMRGYAVEAKNSPASLGEFLTKRLNVWLNAASAWLSVDQWKKATIEGLDWSDFHGLECTIGADLADKADITDVVLVGQHEDGTNIFTPVFFLQIGSASCRARVCPYV